jgi:hypothetical protein
VTAAGLVLNVPEDVVLEFVEVELLLALVTPEQPDWIMAVNKIVANTKRARARGTLRLCGRIGEWRKYSLRLLEAPTWADTPRFTSANPTGTSHQVVCSSEPSEGHAGASRALSERASDVRNTKAR